MKRWIPAGPTLFLASAIFAQATQPAKLPFILSKETTVITAPLNKDGTPNYVAAINEKNSRGVTPQNNGFVLWLEVIGTGDNAMPVAVRDKILALCGYKPADAGQKLWISYNDYLIVRGIDPGTAEARSANELMLARQTLWTAGQYPDLAAYLQQQEKLLEIAQRATRHERWWIPSVSVDGRSVIGSIFPAISSIRDVSMVLLARSTLRAKVGDFDGFLQDVIAVKRLARLVSVNSSLLENLVSAAIDMLANEVIGTLVGGGSLTEAQCNTLSAAFQILPPLHDGVESINTWERLAVLDFFVLGATGHEQFTLFARLMAQNVKGIAANESQKTFAFLDRDFVDWNRALAICNTTMDDLVSRVRNGDLAAMRAACTDYEKMIAQWETASGPHPITLVRKENETREAYTLRVAHSILGSIASNMSGGVELSRRVIMQNDMLPVLLSAAISRARTGRWPPTIQELTPGILKDLPKDPYAAGGGKNFSYKVSEKGPRVYSVGPNGKDDAGILDMNQEKDDMGVGPG